MLYTSKTGTRTIIEMKIPFDGQEYMFFSGRTTFKKIFPLIIRLEEGPIASKMA
jgi:hypothetical protein